MGLGTAYAVALVGLSGHLVEVEAHIAASVPGFTLIGLPDAALSEARERVRAAVTSSGLKWPNRKIIVNLSPASLRKHGSGFDLAIAVAILAGAKIIPSGAADRAVHLGELGLDGRLHPVRGVLPAVAAAIAGGLTHIVVPEDNAAEARLVPGAQVFGAANLAEVARLYGADVEQRAVPLRPQRAEQPALWAQVPDMREVLGQMSARTRSPLRSPRFIPWLARSTPPRALCGGPPSKIHTTQRPRHRSSAGDRECRSPEPRRGRIGAFSSWMRPPSFLCGFCRPCASRSNKANSSSTGYQAPLAIPRGSNW